MKPIITLIFLSCMISRTWAQVYVNHDASGAKDGTSWENAFTDLQIGLTNANSGDQIWVAMGTYKPTVIHPDSSSFEILTSLEIYGGFSGVETLLEERDWEANVTILDGDIAGDDFSGDFLINKEDNSRHIAVVDASNGVTIIDGFTFTGGTARIDNFSGETDITPWTSGAIVIRSSLTIRNSKFSSNRAYIGAVMFCQADSDDICISIDNCVFDSNSARKSTMYFKGLEDFHIKNSTIKDNLTQEYGGGIQLGNSNATIVDCLFEGNVCDGFGGAIHIYQDNQTQIPNAIIKIESTTFRNNSAYNGGAFSLRNINTVSELYIEHCNFFGNNATSGGGLSLRNAFGGKVSVELSHLHFDQNSVFNGGAIYIVNDVLGFGMSCHIDSSQFINNVATGYGGGISSRKTPITVTNSEFANNTSRFSSGAWDSLSDSIQIDNCVFFNNFTQATYGDNDGGGGILFLGTSKATVINSTFEKNISLVEGASVAIIDDAIVHFENNLFSSNNGASNILNKANLVLVNCTMMNNEYGLKQGVGSYTESQNVIWNDRLENLSFEGSHELISKGGNISNDASMIDYLTTINNYPDLNEIEPLLGEDLVPLEDSPCIDAGNANSVMVQYDLAGMDRIQGVTIDIGCLESPYTTVAVENALWNTPELLVFPNPVFRELNFEVKDNWTGELDVTIYDAFGRIVSTSKVNKSLGVQSFQVNVEHLGGGTYFLLVSGSENSYAEKILVVGM